MISLSHRSLIEVSPPDLVRVAAAAGFDAVGFPVLSGLPIESWDMLADTALFTKTVEAVERYGIPVLDVEVIFIEADTNAASFRPLFDAGARLGARFVVAVAMDADEVRVAEHLAALCAEAAPFGLRVMLEFMALTQIRTLAATRRIVAAAGEPRAGIMIDAVHFYRSGATAADLAGIAPDLLPYVQLDDVAGFDALRRAPAETTWPKVLPGSGDLPLTELLRALPPEIPVSLEVPFGAIGDHHDVEAYARRAHQATEAALQAVARR